MAYRIEIFKVGFPGKYMRRFDLQFNSLAEAIAFAESQVKEGEGFSISGMEVLGGI